MGRRSTLHDLGVVEQPASDMRLRPAPTPTRLLGSWPKRVHPQAQLGVCTSCRSPLRMLGHRLVGPLTSAEDESGLVLTPHDPSCSVVKEYLHAP